MKKTHCDPATLRALADEFDLRIAEGGRVLDSIESEIAALSQGDRGRDWRELARERWQALVREWKSLRFQYRNRATRSERR